MTPQLTVPLAGININEAPAAQAAPATQNDKLHKAAHDFEALLIGEMLKTAHADSDDGWLGSGDSAGSDSAMQMAESQLAEALSSGRGLGLASVIEKSMSKRLAEPNLGPARLK
jgi:Rod binding domain-containing protein